MSRKHKRQKQRKAFARPLLMIGGILLILAALFFINQDGDQGGMPAIAVDQQKIDYGNVKFGVNKTFAVKVTNTGDTTLRFTEEPYIEVLEGC